MGFWGLLLNFAITTVIAELVRPKPNIEGAKPGGLGDFSVPTAQEDRVVPIVWGLVRVDGPNLAWYGHLRTKRQRKKVKTGLFKKKKVTTGYRYFLGFNLHICRGPFVTGTTDGIGRIWCDDRLLRSLRTFPKSGTLKIDRENFFGGRKQGGGIKGNLTLYPGDETQGIDSYLSARLGSKNTLLPAYRGTVHLVARQIYVGTARVLRPFSFEVQRTPNGLNLAVPGGGFGVNPMNVIYEIMTNDEWGLGLTNIDTANFTTAANILNSEGQAYARVLDNPTAAQEVLDDIQEQIDGLLYRDPSDGNWKMKLIRETDYTSPTSELPLFDENNCRKVDFSRGSWDETTNQVKVKFVNPNNDFKTSFAVAQDMANVQIQNGNNIVVTKTYSGVNEAGLANDLAWRDLRALSYPLAKGKIYADRSNYNVIPGGLVRLSWPDYGIQELFVRINRVTLGAIDSNEIIYDFTEDVFRVEDSSFGDPGASEFEDIDDEAINAVEFRIVAMPPTFQEQNDSQEYLMLVACANDAHIGYEIWVAEDISAPITLQPRANHEPVLESDQVIPHATLQSNLSQVSGSPGDYTNDTFIVENFVGVDQIDETALVNELNREFEPPNMIIVNNEWMFFQSLTDLGGGAYQLSGVYRGMLDSVPADHVAGDRVWFFTYASFTIAGIDDELANFASSPIAGFSAYAITLALGSEQSLLPSPEVSPEQGVSTLVEASNRFRGAAPAVNPSIAGVRFDSNAILVVGQSFRIDWRCRESNFGSARSSNQESANQDPGAGVTFTVNIYHVPNGHDSSPEFDIGAASPVYTQTGITATPSPVVSPEGPYHVVDGYLVPPSPESAWNPSPLPQNPSPLPPSYFTSPLTSPLQVKSPVSALSPEFIPSPLGSPLPRFWPSPEPFAQDYVIELFSVKNGYSSQAWYQKIRWNQQ